VPQESRPQMVLSGYDHIFYMCLVLGMSRADARKRTQEIMEELELWEHKDKLAVDLSGGLRQRVIIAMALVADPELIFLDEPTIGLDPLGRRAVWHMVRELSKKGVTVILTTHYMDEAEALADRLAIIEKGRLAFLGTVDEAKAVTHEGLHVIVEPAVSRNSADRKVLKPQSNEEILEIVQRSIREGLKVTFKPPTLEEAFIHIVGGSIEEDAA
jgi:ABC-2 type transport system ATP-binding protein